MFDFKNTVESIDFWDTGVFFVFLAVYQNIFKTVIWNMETFTPGAPLV